MDVEYSVEIFFLSTKKSEYYHDTVTVLVRKEPLSSTQSNGDDGVFVETIHVCHPRQVRIFSLTVLWQTARLDPFGVVVNVMYVGMQIIQFHVHFSQYLAREIIVPIGRSFGNRGHRTIIVHLRDLAGIELLCLGVFIGINIINIIDDDA